MKDGLPQGPVRGRWNVQRDCLGATEAYTGAVSTVAHSQPIPPPQEVMTLTRDHLARRLPCLVCECRLLPPDPAQTGNNSQSHGVVAQAARRSYAYTAGRRIDAKMQVLDILSYDLDAKAAYQQLVATSTHVVP